MTDSAHHAAPWSIKNVRRRFFRRSLVVTMLFMLVFVLVLPWFSLHLSIRNFTADTDSVMRGFIQRELTMDVARLQDNPEAYRRLTDRIDVFMHFSSLTEFKIWTDDGTVVYAYTDKQQVGKTFSDNDELDVALESGQSYIEVIRAGEDEENAALTGAGTLVEMYVPIIHDGRPVGAVEVYRIAPQLRYFGVHTLFAAAVAVILPFLLYLILYGEFRRATDTVLGYHARLVKSYQELGRTYFNSIRSLSSALEMRDLETEGHSERVVNLARALGTRMNLDEEDLGKLVIGSYLHDIGKIGIPDSILLKPGALTEEERAEMMGHVVAGAELVRGVDFLKKANDVILSHHERWDGTGYPMGLTGTEIPKVARIFALVDVCDALLSARPYKQPFSYDKTIAIIKDGRGNHFDPDVVDAFLSMGESEIRRVFREADDGSAQPKVRRAVEVLINHEFSQETRGVTG